MKLNRKTTYAQITVLLFLALPSLVYTALPVSSMAPGLALALTIALLLSTTQSNGVPKGTLLATSLFCTAVSFHFILAGTLQPLNASRFVGSLILIAYMIIVSTSTVPLIFDNLKPNTLTPIFWLLTGCATLGILEIQPSTVNATIKPVFPYSEPSIFALSMSSILMFECGNSRGWKRALLCAVGLSIALLLQSLTLLVVVALVLAASLPLRSIVVLIFFALAAITFSAEGFFDYYLDRLNFSSDSQNLTALVYLQGWQMTFESIIRSMGWGGGFQQLGSNPTQVQAADAISNLLGGGALNQIDGSFILVKLVSEFGVFGITAIFLYLKIAHRSFKEFRGSASGTRRISTGRMFANAVVLTFLIEIFLRGAGYLTGTAALLVASITYLQIGNKGVFRHKEVIKRAHYSTTRPTRPASKIAMNAHEFS